MGINGPNQTKNLSLVYVKLHDNSEINVKFANLHSDGRLARVVAQPFDKH